MIRTVLIAAAVWLIVSIPVGLFLARLLARHTAALEAADNAVRDQLQAHLARALRREEQQFVLDVEAWRATQPAE
jgi:MFS-type transporter involved in bile tolerance (Atg22 family)